MPKWSSIVEALPTSGIRKMHNLAAAMSDVVNLSIGQPDFPTPPHIIESYVQALRDGKTTYPLDAGIPELREALAEKYTRESPHQLTPENFLVTTGASEAVYVTLRSLLEPGDEAVLIEPSFTLYAPTVRLCGAQPVIIQTRVEDGFVPAPQRVSEAVNDRTKLILLNSPANPTGATLPRAALEAVVEAAERHDAAIVADEVYDRIVFGPEPYSSLADLVDTLDRVFIINSFAKTYCMPGVRIGYVYSAEANMGVPRRMHMYTTNVGNTAGQWAAMAALTGDQSFIEPMVQEYRRRRDRIVELVAQTPPLTGYTPTGAFYILPALPPGTDADSVMLEMLKATRVSCVPGSTFGRSCRNAFRISYSVSMDQIEEAFNRIRPWLAKQPW